MEEKGAGTIFYSAVAPEKHVVPFLHGIVTPRADKTPFGRRIEPEYTEISQRGKYLTYESRYAAPTIRIADATDYEHLVGADGSVRLRRCFDSAS